MATYPPSADVKRVDGVNCITQRAQSLEISNGRIQEVNLLEQEASLGIFVGPGLIDVQINGIDGIDFNDTRLKPEDMLLATRYLLTKGITTFFPTLITNSDRHIQQLIKTIVKACEQYPLVNASVGGIHLEGPFLSRVDGARGAHNLKYIKALDWEWVQRCQEASEGMIKLVTCAPEWENTYSFIEKCNQHGIRVAIGHSMATPAEIREAVRAGATLSTHLGNAVPLMLPRHPNLLWEQLAQDNLYASIIADGFHLPDAFLKVVIRAKGQKAFLISDATCFSGRQAGVYKTHIGEEVVLDQDGRLAMKNSPELLAGATKCLLEDVQYLLDQKLVGLTDAWKMASINAARFLGYSAYGIERDQPADLVVFQMGPKAKIEIAQVIKDGQTVFHSAFA